MNASSQPAVLVVERPAALRDRLCVQFHDRPGARDEHRLQHAGIKAICHPDAAPDA